MRAEALFARISASAHRRPSISTVLIEGPAPKTRSTPLKESATKSTYDILTPSFVAEELRSDPLQMTESPTARFFSKYSTEPPNTVTRTYACPVSTVKFATDVPDSPAVLPTVRALPSRVASTFPATTTELSIVLFPPFILLS